MLPVTILYNEHIDQQILTEQKSPVEYIVPPHTNVGRKQYGSYERSIISIQKNYALKWKTTKQRNNTLFDLYAKIKSTFLTIS